MLERKYMRRDVDGMFARIEWHMIGYPNTDKLFTS